ncbi:lysine-N-methylase [Escherichia fergusonii]|uniref:lysine-N-methylase n=1 Tax=Escherichia fergusonii TaxID=564 RepID=UPI0011CE2E01|nr:lysine-N-methylase [Escherichia fergusonii]EFL4496448.1 lysine-N-methylase [Escherichia fergusonii]
MSFVECYEPEFVRNFMAQHPDSPLFVRKVWNNEIRLSLELHETASCEALLNDANAFALQLTYRPAQANAQEITARDFILNQALLNVVALSALSAEHLLYGAGILLSRADKIPGHDGVTLASLTALPQTLADLAQNGCLQAQFAMLPSLPQLPEQMLKLSGGFDFDWSLLPDCPRKASLPLQVSLLMSQDANSAALFDQQLKKQWQQTYEQYFLHTPWILSNYLIYRIYHDLIPLAGVESYFQLVSDFFFLRTLLALWTLDGSALRRKDIFALFALFERWRNSENAVEIRQHIQSLRRADPLLSAFSLL